MIINTFFIADHVPKLYLSVIPSNLPKVIRLSASDAIVSLELPPDSGYARRQFFAVRWFLLKYFCSLRFWLENVSFARSYTCWSKNHFWGLNPRFIIRVLFRSHRPNTEKHFRLCTPHLLKVLWANQRSAYTWGNFHALLAIDWTSLAYHGKDYRLQAA